MVLISEHSLLSFILVKKEIFLEKIIERIVYFFIQFLFLSIPFLSFLDLVLVLVLVLVFSFGFGFGIILFCFILLRQSDKKKKQIDNFQISIFNFCDIKSQNVNDLHPPPPNNHITSLSTMRGLFLTSGIPTDIIN